MVTPDGIIIHMSGPWTGRYHDARMLRESDLVELLERHCSADDGPYVIYGDPAYPTQAHIRGPYRGAQLTAEQDSFNTAMSSVRQSVEWCFGDIILLFLPLDLALKAQPFLMLLLFLPRDLALKAQPFPFKFHTLLPELQFLLMLQAVCILVPRQVSP